MSEEQCKRNGQRLKGIVLAALEAVGVTGRSPLLPESTHGTESLSPTLLFGDWIPDYWDS